MASTKATSETAVPIASDETQNKKAPDNLLTNQMSVESQKGAGFHSYHQVKRETSHRVFVNRSLQLSKIKFFGFDMDYTLALYKSPQYEMLAFRLVIEQLLKMGYPQDIKTFVYDPDFPVRGLWYDKLYGNLLKVDAYGNIIVCVHGFRFLKSSEIYKLYPNKYLNYDDSRIYVLNTLFCLPEIYLLASLINYFTISPNYSRNETGVSCGDIFVSFKAIFQDVRFAIDYIHSHGDLKKLTVETVDEYIVKDARLPLLLNRMHDNKAKVFLLTNSGYDYTDKIMSFLLDEKETGRHWRTYFDYIVVDAKKPLFFEEGTSLKEVDINTGIKKFGSHSGPLKQNQVYSGGNCDVFSKLIGSRGKDVLYVGDHIFGDIIKSKKERAWRTFLVVPELSQELVTWHEKRSLFTELERLDKILSEKLIDLDSSSKTCPNVSNIKVQIQKCIHEMDMSYGLLGSLFRSGSRQTHFASQVTRFADIYAASHLNLLHYPFFYLFKAPPMLMPHESTVNPYEPFGDDYGMRRLRRGSSNTDSTPTPTINHVGSSDTMFALTNAVAANQAGPVAPILGVNDISSSLLDDSASSSVSANASSKLATINERSLERNESLTESHLTKPDVPTELTHHQDFDDDDEESDENKSYTPPNENQS